MSEEKYLRLIELERQAGNQQGELQALQGLKDFRASQQVQTSVSPKSQAFPTFEVNGRAFSDPFGSRLGGVQQRRKEEEQAIANLRATAPKNQAFARDLEEIGAAPELRELNLQSARRGVAAGLITNEAELANAIANLTPGAEVQQDPEGRALVKFPSGGTYAVNRPGLSGQDFTQFATRLLSFLPSGKFAGGGAKQLAKGAVAAGSTETVLQGVEAGVGGEFSPGDVALAAATQPVAQAVGAGLSKLKSVANSPINQQAKEIIERGETEGIEVLTSDIFPPDSAFGKAFQQFSEKLGPLGTGGKRAAQQRARIEAVERLADEWGLSVDNLPQLNQVVDSLNANLAKRLQKASQLRGEAIFRLSPMGEVPLDNVQQVISGQIAKERALKDVADQAVITKLDDYSQALRGSNFRSLADIRSNLIADIKQAERGEVLPPKSVKALESVKSSIDQAMKAFASENDRGAAALWLQSNRLNFETLSAAKESVLKRIANNKNARPEDVAPIIKGGKTSDLNRLYSTLDKTGRSGVKASILRDAIEEGGFFAGQGSVERFVNALQKGPRQRAMNVFFKDQDKKMIQGLEKLLDKTRRSAQAAQGTTTGLGELGVFGGVGGIGAVTYADPLAGLLTGATMAATAKGYESKALRNFLLRLAAAKSGSTTEKALIEEALPVITPLLQASRGVEDDQ